MYVDDPAVLKPDIPFVRLIIGKNSAFIFQTDTDLN